MKRIYMISFLWFSCSLFVWPVFCLRAAEKPTVNIGVSVVNPYPEPYVTPPLQPESHPMTSTVYPVYTHPPSRKGTIVFRKPSPHRWRQHEAITPSP